MDRSQFSRNKNGLRRGLVTMAVALGIVLMPAAAKAVPVNAVWTVQSSGTAFSSARTFGTVFVMAMITSPIGTNININVVMNPQGGLAAATNPRFAGTLTSVIDATGNQIATPNTWNNTGSMDAITTGSWTPTVVNGASTGASPADLGIRGSASIMILFESGSLTLDAAVRNLTVDLTSGNLTVTQLSPTLWTIPTGSTAFILENAILDYQCPNGSGALAGPCGDLVGSSTLTNVGATISAGTASIQAIPNGFFELTMPYTVVIQQTLIADTFGGSVAGSITADLSMQIVGQIIARAFIPEPGSMVLLGIGAFALGGMQFAKMRKNKKGQQAKAESSEEAPLV